MLAPTIEVYEQILIYAEKNKYTVFLKMNSMEVSKLTKILHKGQAVGK